MSENKTSHENAIEKVAKQILPKVNEDLAKYLTKDEQTAGKESLESILKAKLAELTYYSKGGALCMADSKKIKHAIPDAVQRKAWNALLGDALKLYNNKVNPPKSDQKTTKPEADKAPVPQLSAREQEAAMQRERAIRGLEKVITSTLREERFKRLKGLIRRMPQFGTKQLLAGDNLAYDSAAQRLQLEQVTVERLLREIHDNSEDASKTCNLADTFLNWLTEIRLCDRQVADQLFHRVYNFSRAQLQESSEGRPILRQRFSGVVGDGVPESSIYLPAVVAANLLGSEVQEGHTRALPTSDEQGGHRWTIAIDESYFDDPYEFHQVTNDPENNRSWVRSQGNAQALHLRR